MNTFEKTVFFILTLLGVFTLSIVSYFFETARHLFLHFLFILSIPPGSILGFLYKKSAIHNN